jgi:hypothetical protein
MKILLMLPFFQNRKNRQEQSKNQEQEEEANKEDVDL